MSLHGALCPDMYVSIVPALAGVSKEGRILHASTVCNVWRETAWLTHEMYVACKRVKAPKQNVDSLSRQTQLLLQIGLIGAAHVDAHIAIMQHGVILTLTLQALQVTC